MSQHQKLLGKARRNPEGLSFAAFQTLMQRCGWKNDPQRGSHQIWYSPQGFGISIQNCNDMMKGYQVRQFLKYLAEDSDEQT